MEPPKNPSPMMVMRLPANVVASMLCGSPRRQLETGCWLTEGFAYDRVATRCPVVERLMRFSSWLLVITPDRSVCKGMRPSGSVPMTWELRSAVAMGLAHLTLLVLALANIVGGATPAQAIELGQLQAVPSQVPPYIFRLPLIATLQGSSANAAVQVRQPPDTIAFV